MKNLLILSLLQLSIQNTFAYEMKTSIVEGFSMPVLLVKSDQLSIDQIRSLRLHFHGWTQNPKTGKAFNNRYDFNWKDPLVSPKNENLRFFVESYGIPEEIEKAPEQAIIIPISRGHCDQYPELMSNFDMIMDRILVSFGIQEDHVRLEEVSAHSGGGEFLSRILDNPGGKYTAQVSKAVFFDALYSVKTIDHLFAWVSSGQKEKSLQLPVILNQTPKKWSDELLKMFSEPIHSMKLGYEGVQIKVFKKVIQNSSTIWLIQEFPQARHLDHWSIVKKMWNYVPESKRKPSSQKN